MGLGHAKFVFSLLVVTGSALAEGQRKPKIKIPHSHLAAVGGEVLMLGDDHLEIKQTKKSKNTLELHFSDKFRDPVPVSAFNLQIALKEGEKFAPLNFKVSAKTPSIGFVELPAGADIKLGELEIRAPRLQAVKGYLSTNAAQKISLSKIFKSLQDPHAGHH